MPSRGRSRLDERGRRLNFGSMKIIVALAALLLSTAGFAAAPLTGQVLEVRDADPYTYVRLKTAEGETWAAVNKAAVKTGESITINRPMVMRNFESKALKKTFDTIVFGTIADRSAAPGAMGASPHGAGGMPKAAVPTVAIKVAKATGADAHTVMEVVSGKTALKDKGVTLRAQVVKVNAGIMGRNWFHVQDGSGSASAGTNDLLVTSKDMAAVGDVVHIQGTVRTDVKLGAGYDYAVLVENASLKK